MKKSSRFYLKYNPDNSWSFWTGKWWSLCSEISGQFTPKLGGQFDRIFHVWSGTGGFGNPGHDMGGGNGDFGGNGGSGGNPYTPQNQNPCEQTKKMIQDPKVQDIVKDLKDHLNSGTGGEKGWRDNKTGAPTPTTQNSAHSVNFGDPSTMNGGYHNHTGTGVNIFSSTDISTLIEISRYQSIGSAGNGYMGLIAPGGIHYVIQFNGSHSEIPAYGSYTSDQKDIWNFEQFVLQRDLLKDANFYDIINGQKKLNNNGLEQIFFKTLEKMNLQNKVTLQKVEENKVLTVNKNPNGTTTLVLCP